MKLKMMVMIGLVVFCMAVIFPGSASAGVTVQEYTVMEAGSNHDTGLVEIWLYKVSADRTKKFVAPADEANQMLATALTALSLGYDVKVKVDWDTYGSPIAFIRILAP